MNPEIVTRDTRNDTPEFLNDPYVIIAIEAAQEAARQLGMHYEERPMTDEELYDGIWD